jgi:hypothetical protein
MGFSWLVRVDGKYKVAGTLIVVALGLNYPRMIGDGLILYSLSMSLDKMISEPRYRILSPLVFIFARRWIMCDSTISRVRQP